MIEEKINSLNLDPIIIKLMDNDEGLGWSFEYAKQIEIEYKKYLSLCLEYSNLAIVPAKPVDEFWHFHILDTLKYQEDCDMIFGHFLHHFPYFGMRGKEDAENLKNAWYETIELYNKKFGSDNNDIWINSSRCPNCGRRCSNDTSSVYKVERPTLKIAI